MDALVIGYYRRLLKSGFENAGVLEYPSIFLDSVGDKVDLCGHMGGNYMHIYINISGETITDIKYICLCDPTANVVAELLCTLAKGKPLSFVQDMTEETFATALGSHGQEWLKKAGAMMELIHRGVVRYLSSSRPLPEA